MNIYDAAHNLAKAIKNSNEYNEFAGKQKKIASNPKTKEMIEDFRKKAMEVQMQRMSGQEVDSAKEEEIKKLEGIVMADPVIREYFSAEMRFSQVMNDIYKIIGESIESNLK